MLRFVFTFIYVFFVLLLQSQSNLSPSGDVISDSELKQLPDARHDEGVKIYLSTSSYFYDVGETVLCNLIIVNAGNLQPIAYYLPCQLTLSNPKGQKLSSEIIESSMGSINKSFAKSYFKTGGEYTLIAECLLNGSKVSCERKFIFQEKIETGVFIEVKANKEQYMSGDSLKMKIIVRSSHGKFAVNKKVKVIGVFNSEPVDTTSFYTNAKGECLFSQKINESYSENNLIYLVKVFVDEVWESHIERINLNTGTINISTFLENGYYKLDKQNSLILYTTNDFGDLTKAVCVVYNLKTKDSFFIETNAFGFCKMTLSQGDSIQHYIISSQKNRNYFSHMEANKESLAGITVASKNQQFIAFKLTSDVPEKMRFVSHIRGKIIIDSFLMIPTGGSVINVSVSAFMPGVMQSMILNNRNEILAQKLNFINRYKQLKVSAVLSPGTLTANTQRQIDFKITDENNQPVEGVFNLSITDHKNTLVIEDKQSHISENLLFESDLHYPAKDIGKLWKSPVVDNDSLLDLFLNGCELNETYLPQILQQNKQITSCYYQFILKDGRNSQGTDLRPDIRKIKVKSDKGNYNAKVNERGEIYIPVDSIVFPCRFFIYGRGHHEVLYINETHAKIALKTIESHYIGSPSKDSFYMAGGQLPKLGNPIFTSRNYSATAYFRDGVRTYSSCCTVMSNKNLYKTGQRSFMTLVGLASGVTVTSSGLSGRGSRTDGTAYYIDGVRVLTPYDSPEYKGGDIAYFKNMNLGSSGGTTGYSGYYRYYSSPTTVANRYSIKKYRPNGTPMFKNNNFQYEYSNSAGLSKTTTYYWETGITTNSKGVFSKMVKFPRSAVVWHLNIEGISKGSLCAEFDTILTIEQGVYMKIKAPERLLSNDTADISVSVYNTSDVSQAMYLLADLPYGSKSEFLHLKRGEQKEIIFKYNALSTEEISFELLEVNKMTSIQKLEKRIVIEEKLYSSQSINTLFNAKKELVNISLQCQKLVGTIIIHQSQSAGFENKLLNMIREPAGCFEQVSSTNYPNILAYQYLKENLISESEKVELLNKKKYLESGYNKLANYETSTGGFSWYGEGKGNEALTAMGLLQFHKLKKCDVAVSDLMVERSKVWLLKSRNSKGIFMQSQGRYGFANTSQNVAHAYITYTLNELGEMDLEKSIMQIQEQLSGAPNFYNEALLFAIYLKRNDTEKAKRLYEKVLKKCIDLMDGKSINKETIQTIVNSYYDAAVNESLCIIANSIFSNKQNEYLPLANKIGEYILNRDFNTLGNMQSKAMAVETIYFFTSKNNLSGTTSNFTTISVNDKVFRYNIDGTKNLNIDISEYLNKGKNTIRMIGDTGKTVNAELILTQFSPVPIGVMDDKDYQFSADIKTAISSVGDMLNYAIKIKNTSNKVLPQTVAVIALPAGVNVDPAELLFLKKNRVIDFYEITDGKLVLYFEEINSRQEIAFNLPLLCEIKGIFDIKGCCIYKYYQAENKSSYLPGRIVIK